MVYVGVLASICDIDMDAVEAGIRREFPGRKAKAAEININAARPVTSGRRSTSRPTCPTASSRWNRPRTRSSSRGTRPPALGALFGGANVLTWYPITPSSSLAEYAEEFLKKHRSGPDGKHSFAIVQAEDELAAVGMAIGAGWGGARALTATSGPGISLMSEFVGLAYFAEIPVVIIDVQRMGPSTGLPTRTSQGDILKMHLLGHGDCRHIVLIPGSVEECYEMTIEALDLAQQFQTPVFMATDLDLGMNLWLSSPFTYPTKPIQRGKVLDRGRPRAAGQLRAVQGPRRRRRLLPHDPRHREPAGRLLHARHRAQREVGLQRAPRGLEEEPRPPGPQARDGPQGRPRAGRSRAISAPASACSPTAAPITPWPRPATCSSEQGISTEYCRLRALPVADEVISFIERHQRVYVIEQNRDAQITSLLRSSLRGALADRLVPVTHYNGMPIAAENIVRPILGWEKHPSGPGWPTGNVERDNPPFAATPRTSLPSEPRRRHQTGHVT